MTHKRTFNEHLSTCEPSQDQECPTLSEEERKNRIRNLNDCLRVHGLGGMVVCTLGVQALQPAMIEGIVDAVRSFSDFTDENDPHEEHDCALLEVDGLSVMFKIDYLDTTLSYHSEDPTDPMKTARVMTIMLAEEY